jgi:hypothetical protein
VDNFHFDMTCEGDEPLRAAFTLVWKASGIDGSKRGATHYAIRPVAEAVKDAEKPYLDRSAKSLRLVFFEYHGNAPKPDMVAMPFLLDAEAAYDFARRWLAQAEYPRQPDHDGDNERGWRIYNEDWGHVDGDDAIIAVSPVWAMYGK